jgi:hypothetical protein
MAMPYRCWRFDECDVVAALSLAEALDWYRAQTGVEAETIEDWDLQTEFWTGEWAGDGDLISFSAAIAEHASAGLKFPVILASYEP